MKTDLKAAVKAMQLAQQGIPPEQIRIIPRGMMRKGVEEEVASIESVYTADGVSKFVHINTNRAGIYDTLPEGIFHKPASYNQFADSIDLKDSIQRNRAIQENARKLLAPADITFNEARCRLAGMEMELTMGDRKLLGNILGEWCRDLSILDNKQLWQWIGYWQKIAEIRNDTVQMTNCLQQVLGMAVVCRFVPAASFLFENKQRVGQMSLGFDSLLSGSCCAEEVDLEISVQVRSEKELQYLLKPGGGMAALDKLIQYLAGADIPVRKVIRMNRPTAAVQRKGKQMYVGINTYL